MLFTCTRSATTQHRGSPHDMIEGTSPQDHQIPRHHLLGGDLPKGGIPAAIGHAGRSQLRTSLLRISYAITTLLVQCALCLCNGSVALASEQITFENGGTATLTDQGCIEGTCELAVVWHNLAETFTITMPDGQVMEGHCIDFGLVGPANGSYSFTATPNLDGSYHVRVHSDKAAYYATPSNPYTPAEGAAIQRVELDNKWTPTFRKRTASLTLRKVSDGPAGGESLAGAKYAVWRDAACTTSAGPETQLTTKADGTANTVSVEPGTYWVREFEAPAGFELDPTVHEVTVADNATIEIQASDTPTRTYLDVWVTKVDAQCATAQGTSTLEGAEFTICYYDGNYEAANLPAQPTRTWVLRSDAAGLIKPGTDSLVEGDSFYTDDQGAIYLPPGTYTIRETKAPAGYLLEGQQADSDASYQAPIHLRHLNHNNDYDMPTIDDEVQRAGISIQKTDADISEAQGDASLANIEFTITNKNEQPVVVDGETYAKDKVIAHVTTDEQGVYASSSNYLPLGTYEIAEVQTNASMLYSPTSQLITLDSSDANKVVTLSSTFVNQVARGAIRVQKISHETNGTITQGAASLSGAQISITNSSQHAVWVGGARYENGDVVCLLSTDGNGYAQTEDRALPYGTYVIREAEPPVGYLANEEWSEVVEIREDGSVTSVSGEVHVIEDQVIRGGFHFDKIDADSMEHMPGVVFRVTSLTTNESHLLVSDDNGVVSTEGAAHTERTNANDLALGADGIIDESKLDATAGVWFYGLANADDMGLQATDEMCALPFDTYRVEELSTSKNEGKQLVSFLVCVREHSKDIDMGTIDNKTVRLSTTLTHEGSGHLAPVDKQVTLVDEVRYENLIAGESYRLVGKLCFTPEGEPSEGTEDCDANGYVHEYVYDAQGAPLVVEKTFTPLTSSGIEYLSFSLDSSLLAGRSVVAVEYLMQQDTEISRHDDLMSASQTVYFPSIGTLFTDSEGNHEIRASGLETTADSVRYENLETGKTYQVVGTLMDVTSESPVLDAYGIPVSGSTTFTPDEPSGTVQVSFALDEEYMAGKKIVAFEQLKHGNTTLVSHEDLTNLDQTITIPRLQTTLTDTNGHHVLSRSGSIELVDNVQYSALEIGAQYTITGTLMDRETGEAVLDEQGVALTSSVSFQASEETGSVDVPFVCSHELLEGRTIVAFEELTRDDRTLAIHADINDEAQTVYLPSIGTTLTTSDHSHTCAAHTSVTLNDIVRYRSLRTGVPYTITGTLMDYDTKQALTDKDGNAIRASKEFTPNSSSGEIELSFMIDTTSLSGHKIVAFESMSEGSSSSGRIVAAHEDWEDADQTVTVDAPQEETIEKEKEETEQPSSEKETTVKQTTSKEKTPATGDSLRMPVASLLVATFLVVTGMTLRRRKNRL